MTDPIVTAVTDVAEVGTSKLELIIIAVISLSLLYGGWYARGVYEHAGETVAAVAQVKAQQASDSNQFKADLQGAEKTAKQAKADQKLNEKANATIIKTPMPNCYLPDSRVQLLNTAAHRQ